MSCPFNMIHWVRKSSCIRPCQLALVYVYLEMTVMKVQARYVRMPLPRKRPSRTLPSRYNAFLNWNFCKSFETTLCHLR